MTPKPHYSEQTPEQLPEIGVYQIASDFRVQCEPRGATESVMDPDIQLRIDRIWAAACGENPSLFNGDLFAVKGVCWQTPDTVQGVTGQYVGYREYVAQLRDPSLQPVLQIHPVGVSGCILLNNQVLIAKRRMHLTHYPGAYELPPAGGVDATVLKESGEVDVLKLLQIELKEETGIESACGNWVKHIRPVALVVSEADSNLIECTRIYDICYDVLLDPALDPEQVLAVISAAASHPQHGEYQEPKWLHKAEISAFVAENADKMVPTSRMLLKTKMA